MVRIRGVGFFGILSSPVVLCLPHLSPTGGHAVSCRRPAFSLSNVLQVGLSFPVPITKSELRTAASNCESSRTGPIQRVECCGAIMIPRRRTLILPWPLPLPFTQPLRGLQHSVQTHAHRMMINDEITAASELRPNCRGSAGDRKPDS